MNEDFVLTRLEGYAGIRLVGNKPLFIKPGINLIVGKNGTGKSNLLKLVRAVSDNYNSISTKIESSFFEKLCKKALQDTRNIEWPQKFGEIPIVSYDYQGQKGAIILLIRDVPNKHVLENLSEPGFDFKHNLDIRFQGGGKFSFRTIGDHSPNLDLEKFRGSANTNFFSHHDNKDKMSSLFEDSFIQINKLLNSEIRKLLSGTIFKESIKHLEEDINLKLSKFFKNTNKSIQIKVDSRYFKSEVHLKDRGDYIDPENLSTGESKLLNMIISFALQPNEQVDFLSFDEPEQHMHDDMIKVFVNEVRQLTELNRDQKILIATHSTSLIENLSKLGNKNVNLITFNGNREVSNANKDIDLINALNRNGVWFSPLMLTKKPNLFIENQGQKGFEHRDFLKAFFDQKNTPNIIPIGSSGNVEQSDNFTSVFEDVLKTAEVKSWGIRDGDIWLKQYLYEYMEGGITLKELILKLSHQQTAYIVGNKPNQFFFNCWEIENLYFNREVLQLWEQEKSPLTLDKFIKILSDHKEVLFNQFFDTYWKKLVSIRNNNNNPQKRFQTLENQLQRVIQRKGNINQLQFRIDKLIEEILDNSVLLAWIPGKEVMKLIKKLGYIFDSKHFNFSKTFIGADLQSIIKDE